MSGIPRACVVTGATGGIGSAVTLMLARRGVDLILNGRNVVRLGELQRACRKEGVQAEVVAGDAADEKLLSHMFSLLRSDSVGAVFASGFAKFGDTLSLDESVWDDTIVANLTALYRGNRIAIQTMLPLGGGRIVNVLSIASRIAFPNAAAYVASKYGALGLTRSLAAEFRTRGIEIIAVLPGSTDTPLWDRQDEPLDREKMLSPSDVAQIIVDALLHEGDAYVDEVVVMPHGGVL